jgi:predicted RNase H-related nuclease YkuK (DUF458 family)
MSDDVWFTGTGIQIAFNDIVDSVRNHCQLGGKVFVGSDSFLNKDKCTFTTAICLHGAKGQSGGNYFVRRKKFPKSKFNSLVHRITIEVNQSVELGLQLLEHCPRLSIELHLDVSAPEKKMATSKFSDALVGYARGAGFETKIKPNSWAAAAVADKHSK